MYYARFDPKLVQGTPDGLIDNVLDGLRPVIEGWHRRHYHRTSICHLLHGPYMASM
jgi:hypothetical protein